MQILDFFESIEKAIADFNKGIADIGQKIDNFSQNVGSVANDIANSVDSVSNAIAGVTKGINELSSSTSSFSGDVITALASFNTFYTAANNVGKAINGLNIKIAITNGLKRTQSYIVDKLEFAYTKLIAKTGILGKGMAALRTKFAATTVAKIAAKVAALGFSAALTATGIGAIVIAIGALIAGLTRLGRSLRESREEAARQAEENERQAETLGNIRRENAQLILSAAELSRTVTDSARARAAANEAELRSIDERTAHQRNLLSSLEELNSLENKSASDRQRMDEIVNQLNKSMGEHLLYIDEETGLLNKSIDSIERQIEVRDELSRLDTKRERTVEILNDQAKIYDELNGLVTQTEYITRKLNDTEQELNEETRAGLYQTKQHLANATQMLENRYNDLGQEYANVGEQIDYLIEQMEKSEAAAEAMYQAQRTALTALGERYQNLETHARNMFSVINTESEKTAQTFISNMRDNQQAMDEWADNMDAMAGRFAKLGLSDEVLKHFREMELEGAGYVKNLVVATDEELKALAYYWERGAERAVQSAAAVWDVDESLINQARNLIESTTQTIDDKLKEAGFERKGQYIPEALAKGIAEYSKYVDTASDDMASLPGDIFKDKNLIHSPSRLFISYGEMIVEGLINGIQSAERNLIRAVTSKIAEMHRVIHDAIHRMLDSVNNLLRIEGYNVGRNFFRALGEGLISEQANLLTQALQTAAAIRAVFESSHSSNITPFAAMGADIFPHATPISNQANQHGQRNHNGGDTFILNQHGVNLDRPEDTGYQAHRAYQRLQLIRGNL